MRAPRILPAGDAPRARHHAWLCWTDDDAAPAHAVVWRMADGRMMLKGIVANREFRGRDMLRWIADAWGLAIHVVEVLPSAMGFWDRMLDEGTIASWEPSDGFASPLERRAVPLGPTRAAPAAQRIATPIMETAR